MAYQVIYALFAVCAVAGGVNVISQRNPVNCAIALLFTFISVAALYIIHGSPLMAMIQIIVYAGAILILVVFTIMLLALRFPEREKGRFWTLPQQLAAVVAAILLAAELLFIAFGSPSIMESGVGSDLANIADPATLGNALFSKYLLPFEVAGVLLLAAIIGAVVLTRRPPGTAAMIDAPHADEEGGAG